MQSTTRTVGITQFLFVQNLLEVKKVAYFQLAIVRFRQQRDCRMSRFGQLLSPSIRHLNSTPESVQRRIARARALRSAITRRCAMSFVASDKTSSFTCELIHLWATKPAKIVEDQKNKTHSHVTAIRSRNSVRCARNSHMSTQKYCALAQRNPPIVILNSHDPSLLQMSGLTLSYLVLSVSCPVATCHVTSVHVSCVLW